MEYKITDEDSYKSWKTLNKVFKYLSLLSLVLIALGLKELLDILKGFNL